MKKYKLTEESIIYYGNTLYRIEALKDFGDIKKGDKGGYIEKYSNLSDAGNAWIFDDAKVYGDAKVLGDAKVCGNAWVYDNAMVFDDAWIFGNATIFDNAKIYENAKISGNAEVSGNAKIFGKEGYIVFKNNWSSGRFFTYTKSNKMWKVGCFYGTGDELVEKAYTDSDISGKCYEAYVRLVENLEKIQK